MWILIAFILVPLIEIGLFIQVGGLIGLWPTLGVVLLTAVVGTSLVRSQGAQAMADLRGSMAELRDPMAPLAHGAMILLAGALLLTPGFFTDTCGILLLIPKVRQFAIREFGKRVTVAKFEMGSRAGGFSAGFGGGPQQNDPSAHPFRRGAPQDGVIDGDYSEVEADPNQIGNRPSGWTKPKE
ncbi:FxsA family protein [Albirhodobacter sp. R86504]|uniref:FxsA family protein n=1 Tax=Albirhodobacter sp. R86504 TaxID=3093848 RepID=UPI00366DBF3B